MASVILNFNCSLDGVVTEIEKWMDMTDEIIEDGINRLASAEAVFFGGRTFKGMADYWLNAEYHPTSPAEQTLAKRLNSMKKIAGSRSEVDTSIWPGSQLLQYRDSRDLAAKVNELKGTLKGNLTIESGLHTWRQFLEARCFDEILMVIHPVVAGHGEKLFAETAKIPLRLLNTQKFANGAVQLHYRRVST